MATVGYFDQLLSKGQITTICKYSKGWYNQSKFEGSDKARHKNAYPLLLRSLQVGLEEERGWCQIHSISKAKQIS